jgi:hypothetical protein
MYALDELEKLYPGGLDESKVLLIHAGGFSKRLPNVSVTGKIFAVLPFGEPIYTMLEMKLASYIEFPSKMSPGVSATHPYGLPALPPPHTTTTTTATAIHGQPSSLPPPAPATNQPATKQSSAHVRYAKCKTSAIR